LYYSVFFTLSQELENGGCFFAKISKKHLLLEGRLLISRKENYILHNKKTAKEGSFCYDLDNNNFTW